MALAISLAIAGMALPASATDFDFAGGRLRATGNVTYGWMVRTEAQDQGLLFNANASLVGLAGTAVGGKNADDGNLNFNKDDTVSMPLKAYLTLDYQKADYGLLASVKAWYDFGLVDLRPPWGNLPNNLTAGAPLSTEGAQTLAKFKGIVGDNAYVYGVSPAGNTPVDWKLGYQKLDWGNRFVIVGGLRDLNALDLPASLRPGAIPVDETRIAAPMAFAGFSPAPNWRVEGYWQIHWQRNTPNQCGTLFGQQDWLAEGCNKAMFGAVSDRQALIGGNYFKRGNTIPADGQDEGGVAAKYTYTPWATEFGAYATRFHSRAAFFSGTKSLRTTGAPYIPGDPGGLNPTYFVEFPEAIHMIAFTFDRKLQGGAVFGELSYRPNQPLQYNSGDLVAAASSNTAPTPLRPLITPLAPGSVFPAWERHKNVQLQLGAGQAVPGALGAGTLNFGGEVVYKGVPDLPDPVSSVRFGRSDTFGNGPVNGVCAANNQLACTSNGYVSKHAWGFRARASNTIPGVFEGVDLVPTITYAYDIKGWSGDAGIIEGRSVAALSLRANFRQGWTADIAWWPTWGGDYNITRDRSTAQASIGYRF